MSHQFRKDARVVGQHAVASLGTSKRKPGFKLGNRLRKDVVGEGPRKPPTAFDDPGSRTGTAMALAAQQGNGFK